ncbi:N-acetyltransferase [candidate division GN15 bacterium]|nr:N-acetyltransferase [candidate division GN15 bacterium]
MPSSKTGRRCPTPWPACGWCGYWRRRRSRCSAGGRSSVLTDATRDYFVHDTALVATDRIGAGTRIWAFCNIQRDVTIGRDCNICDHCSIEPNVVVGDRVTVKNGVSLWDGMTIEDDVFIGPNAVFTNDVFPRSKKPLDQPDRTLLRQGATIGANAVVVAGRVIGRWAFIGAGAVVTRDAGDFTLWLGNPARPVGYVCRCARRLPVAYEDEVTGDSRSVTCECGLEYRIDVDGVTELS